MLRFQAGDEGAFTELVHRFQDRVVSLASRYLGSSADAEDLAQEVFLRVYRAKETYRPTARFSTWVHRVTVNASLNLIRGRKVRRKVSGEMPRGAGDDEGPPDFADLNAPEPHAELEKRELADVLQAVIGDLPPRQRIAILLNKYQDLSYEETAAAMDLTLMAVKSLLTRARVNLKDRLAAYLDAGHLDGEQLKRGANPTRNTS